MFILQCLSDVERRFPEEQTDSGVSKMPKQTTPTMPRPATPRSSPLFTADDAALAAMRAKVIGPSSCSNQRISTCHQQSSVTGAHLIFGKGSSHCVSGSGPAAVTPANVTTSNSDILNWTPRPAKSTSDAISATTATTGSSIFNNLCEGIEQLKYSIKGTVTSYQLSVACMVQ